MRFRTLKLPIERAVASPDMAASVLQEFLALTGVVVCVRAPPDGVPAVRLQRGKHERRVLLAIDAPNTEDGEDVPSKKDTVRRARSLAKRNARAIAAGLVELLKEESV